jgi:hypothetical protein
LIKSILPESGAALIAGQWGTFKTTVALDLTLSVMTGLLFAGRYRIKRRGAVLYIALEGVGMLAARLAAIAAHRNVNGTLPFAWRGDCPALTDKDAADTLCDLVGEAATELTNRFGVPIVLIIIDTMVSAAQYAEGADNDAAATQKVMGTLAIVAQRTSALVVGIDHFGKVVETGTRGSSVKEGTADTVLALLADRETGGGVKNTRLAVRKQRDGVSGFEIPFTVQMTETGRDDDDEPINGPVIEWQAAQQTTTKRDTRWTPSMQLLRRVLETTLVDHGRNAQPFIDGPQVCACDIERVREEFYRQDVAEGDEEKKQATRRKNFNRAIRDGKNRGVIATREMSDDVQLIWLIKPEATANF